MTRLFVNDERLPPDDDLVWTIVRSSQEAIDYVTQFGIPSFISLDHDLGGEDTAVQFVKWMLNGVYDGALCLPDSFGFYVHSQNPVGAERLRGLMDLLINIGSSNI